MEKTPFTETRRFRIMRTVIGAANPLIRALLASRFGERMNRSLLLLRFRGRTSGDWYSTPVSYARDDARIVVVTSPSYQWWKNIRDGADVEVRTSGQWYVARARVLSPQEPAFDTAVALQVAERGPNMLHGFGLDVDDAGYLTDEARADADRHALLVELILGDPLDEPTA